MLINGKTHKTFNFKDINSLISFEEWIKENLSLYADSETVPREHLQTYLEYIKQTVYEQRVVDKKDWIEKIDSLIERTKNE